MKSKIIITKDMSTEERMEALRKATRKFNKKMGKNASVKRDETSFMDKFSDGENIHAWTDAPKYLDEILGKHVTENIKQHSPVTWKLVDRMKD